MNPIRSIVDSQFKSQNLLLGFAFFLSPAIVFALLLGLFGFSLNFSSIGLGIAKDFAYWVLASIVLFILLLAFKGKETNGHFKGIMSALSVTYLISAITFLLMAMVVHVSIPGFFAKIASLQGKEATFEQLVSVISSMALPDSLVLLVIYGIIAAIGLLALLFSLYVPFRIGNLVKPSTGFSNSVMVVVYLGIAYLVSLGLGTIFALI